MSVQGEIYDSAKRGHPLIEEIKSLYKFRDLIQQNVSSSIKTRYKRSIIGVGWTLLNPLLTMIVLTVVFSKVMKISSSASYPVYLLSGLVVWNFFSSTTIFAMQGMVMSGGLLNRIFVPKSVFAVSAMGTGLVNLGLSCIPLFAIALVLGVQFRLTILLMPLAVVFLLMFTLGFGLILAAAAAFFADMQPVYEVLLTMWWYATPVFYPISFIPEEWLWLFKLNPMYYMVEIFRRPLVEGVFNLEEWAVAAAFAIFFFIVGGLIFTSKTNEYAYRL